MAVATEPPTLHFLRIAGVAVTEFMPDRDIDGMGAKVAAQVLAGVMGIVARG